MSKHKVNCSTIQVRTLKRQLLCWLALQDGYAYFRYSRRKHKLRIALNKRTYWIIHNEMKK